MVIREFGIRTQVWLIPELMLFLTDCLPRREDKVQGLGFTVWFACLPLSFTLKPLLCWPPWFLTLLCAFGPSLVAKARGPYQVTALATPQLSPSEPCSASCSPMLRGEEADGVDYSKEDNFTVASSPWLLRELVFKKYLGYWLGLAISVFGISWLNKFGR